MLLAPAMRCHCAPLKSDIHRQGAIFAVNQSFVETPNSENTLNIWALPRIPVRATDVGKKSTTEGEERY